VQAQAYSSAFFAPVRDAGRRVPGTAAALRAPTSAPTSRSATESEDFRRARHRASTACRGRVAPGPANAHDRPADRRAHRPGGG